MVRFWELGYSASLDWAGAAPWATPPDQFFGIEVFNIGDWLKHGDSALEAKVDFLAVVEHRLILARVRSGIGLGGRDCLLFGLRPLKIPHHVGNAGVGVISMREAPVALPSFATSQFKVFFDCGRAVRCLLPLGAGRFMHLVVLYGYQVSDTDAEQLALTEQLFDAAKGELGHLYCLSWMVFNFSC